MKLTISAYDRPAGAQEWKVRHNAAMTSPRGNERAIVELFAALDGVCEAFADGIADYLLRDDVLLPMFQAASSLLNWDLGRLDGGTLSAWLFDRAASVGIDLDANEVTDGGDDDDDGLYCIMRMRFEGETTIVRTGLTLAEAQEHCSREDTHGDGWFDGYDHETPARLAAFDHETQDAAR